MIADTSVLFRWTDHSFSITGYGMCLFALLLVALIWLGKGMDL